MSDWHDEFTEPMHDTPADKVPLIAAMEAAGYTYDGLESTNDNLRFFGEGGQVITMGGWHDDADAGAHGACEEIPDQVHHDQGFAGIPEVL